MWLSCSNGKRPPRQGRRAECVGRVLMWGERHLITWHRMARKLVSRPGCRVKRSVDKCIADECRSPIESPPHYISRGLIAWSACLCGANAI